MVSDEAARARLRARIEAEMGTETADLLTEEFVTIHGELRAIRSRLDGVDHRFDSVDHRFDLVDHRFDLVDLRLQSMRDQMSADLHRELGIVRQDMLANTRMLFFSAIGSTFTAAGLAFAAVRFG